MRFDAAVVRITWLGHSTVQIELDGVRLLTDPVFRRWLLHMRRVALSPEAVEDVDAVLVSHLHHDHFDTRALARLGPARVLVPSGTRVRTLGFEHVDVGESVEVGPVTVTATRAEHGKTRARGYLISGSVRVYFAGDTDLFDGMRALAPVDIALLPIAGWGPRLPPGHLDPLRAAQALELLRPRIAVPIHWGTYRRIGLSRDERILREPAASFAELARAHAPDVDVRILPVGGSIDVSPVREAVAQ
jgi:L-ascorbate metabolism protein UlaG (beta-lactamase superfamily)